MLQARWTRNCILVAAAALLLLRFAHLSADFPAHIYFEDAVQTDEGWYASGPVHLHTWGTWLLPGDFNPAVGVPLWPGIVRVVFHFFGYGIVPLRAIAVIAFAGCLALLWVVLRRYDADEWNPPVLLVLAANPYCYVFSRIAFLDVPALFFVLLAVVILSAKANTDASFSARHCVRLLGAGLALGCGVLTKSTALVFLPLLAFAIFEDSSRRVRTAIFNLALIFSASAAVCAAYWFIYARLHTADLHLLFAENHSNLRFTPHYFIADVTRPIRWGLQSDRLLFPLCLFVLAASALVRPLRILWRDRLYVFAALWIVSSLGYMSFRNYAPPRYYVTLVPALALMTIALLRNVREYRPRLATVLLALLLVDIAANAAQTILYIARPHYSFEEAARAMQAIIKNEGDSNPVVLSQSSDEISLYTGLKPVNLLWHTASMNDELDHYQPTWSVQESRNDDGTCFANYLSTAYSARSMGVWAIFGNQHMTLWRLERLHPGSPLPVPTPAQAAACRPPDYLAGTR
jgi:4-amino-4-deoxy-L-arabinose transferase-like glycosyltransferase